MIAFSHISVDDALTAHNLVSFIRQIEIRMYPEWELCCLWCAELVKRQLYLKFCSRVDKQKQLYQPETACITFALHGKRNCGTISHRNYFSHEV